VTRDVLQMVMLMVMMMTVMVMMMVVVVMLMIMMRDDGPGVNNTNASIFSVPLLKAYGFNPLQLALACISSIRSASGGSGTAGSSRSSSSLPVGDSETDALLFNPLDEAGD